MVEQIGTFHQFFPGHGSPGPEWRSGGGFIPSDAGTGIHLGGATVHTNSAKLDGGSAAPAPARPGSGLLWPRQGGF